MLFLDFIDFFLANIRVRKVEHVDRCFDVRAVPGEVIPHQLEIVYFDLFVVLLENPQHFEEGVKMMVHEELQTLGHVRTKKKTLIINSNGVSEQHQSRH